MKKIISFFLFLLLIVAGFSAEILKIEISGNKRISNETVLYYFNIQNGMEYNPKLIDEGVKKLWETGYFSDIKIFKKDTLKGVILKLILKEAPLIKSIEYKTKKGVKKSDIEKYLDENGAKIVPFSYFSEYKVIKLKKALKKYFKDKGYDDAKIEVKKRFEDEDIVIEIFIDKGEAIKINKITFTGDKKYPSFYIRLFMKEQRPSSLFSAIAGKDTFIREKLNEDLKNIKEFYLNKGYLEVRIGKPKIYYVRKLGMGFRKTKMVNIEIPVYPGPRYRIGEIKINGNKVIPSRVLKKVLNLKKGKYYSLKKRNEGIQEIQKLYGNFGYFYCQVMPSEQLDTKNKKVNIIVNIVENKKAYLRYLNFKGNTYTKDFVLRREFFLVEGGLFRLSAFENSIRRMKQLGLVDITEMPEVKPDPKDPTQIDITVKVKEMGRNMFQFSGGYSGYEGTFVMFSYSTVNFMGTGEQLGFMIMYGSRTKNYRFSFTEPYIFNLPMNLGFSIFKQRLIYPGLFDKESSGATLSYNARVYRYLNYSFSYRYENIKVYDINEALYGYYMPYYYYTGSINLSSIINQIYYSTVDSPIDPTSGVMYLFSLKLSGTFLGGDYDLLTPQFAFTKYFRGLTRKHTFGFHFDVKWIKMLKDTNDIPFYERFYLGGERSIRGFDIYRIGPKNEYGGIIGGDKAFQFNMEYKIPLGQNSPVSLILFYDTGNVWAIGKSWDFKDLYTSTGVEFRIFIPMLRVPFRFIFSYNPRVVREGDEHFVMRFGVGPTF